MSANVIKVRSNNNSPAVFKITKEAHEASLEAKEIVARAHEQAAELMEETQREKEKVLAESSARGYAAGLDQWNDALAEAWKKRDDYLAGNEAELVKLAIAVAKKIIGGSVEIDHGVVLNTVRQALRSIHSKRRVTISVNPSDEDAVREQARSLRVLGAAAGDLAVIGNSAVEAGGCIVESDLGIIDAQISTQLTSIENALLRRFDGGNH